MKRMTVLIAFTITVGGLIVVVLMHSARYDGFDQIASTPPIVSDISCPRPEDTVVKYFELVRSRDKVAMSKMITGIPDSYIAFIAKGNVPEKDFPSGRTVKPDAVAQDYPSMMSRMEPLKTECEFRGIEGVKTVGKDSKVFLSVRCFDQAPFTITFLLTHDLGEWKIFSVIWGRDQLFLE
ncbi:MAG: hypothetical protein IPK58_12465 [Acidobacteria bacterium]|nr:hypothetical protein [Acidobacteriota bacterium]